MISSVSNSFNEAEAIKPRNPEQLPSLSNQMALIIGFNEAEAIKPRNPIPWQVHRG